MGCHMGASASLRPHGARPRPRDSRVQTRQTFGIPANSHVGAGGSKATADSTDTTPSSAPPSVWKRSRAGAGLRGRFPCRPAPRHPWPPAALRPKDPFAPSPPPRPVPKSSGRMPVPNRARYGPRSTPGIVVRQPGPAPRRRKCLEGKDYNSRGAQG